MKKWFDFHERSVGLFYYSVELKKRKQIMRINAKIWVISCEFEEKESGEEK